MSDDFVFCIGDIQLVPGRDYTVNFDRRQQHGFHHGDSKDDYRQGLKEFVDELFYKISENRNLSGSIRLDLAQKDLKSKYELDPNFKKIVDDFANQIFKIFPKDHQMVEVQRESDIEIKLLNHGDKQYE